MKSVMKPQIVPDWLIVPLHGFVALADSVLKSMETADA